jgi:hypothetical protein
MTPSSKRPSSRKRLVCVVEGKGEVQAIPNLCARIFAELSARQWVVDKEPVRQPRSRLVDERARSPLRGPRTDHLRASIEMAIGRPADAVLILCDSDDDCAATWGPAASAIVTSRVRGGAVMVVREYESWLLADKVRGHTVDGRRIEEVRDAKKLLTKFVPNYKPTVHQLAATREIDIAKLRVVSQSFDKLVRALAAISGRNAGPRPLAA